MVHTEGYGHLSNGAPVTPSTLMRIASLSKAMTSTAVLQLVESGAIDLDKLVRFYFPEFRLADGRDDEITVRQILGQTSGLNDRAAAQDDTVPQSLSEAVAGLTGNMLATPPGSHFAYHNPNYAIAARLVEKVSGRSFDRYLDEQVFSPAAMSRARSCPMGWMARTSENTGGVAADLARRLPRHCHRLPGSRSRNGGRGGRPGLSGIADVRRCRMGTGRRNRRPEREPSRRGSRRPTTDAADQLAGLCWRDRRYGRGDKTSDSRQTQEDLARGPGLEARALVGPACLVDVGAGDRSCLDWAPQHGPTTPWPPPRSSLH